MQQYNFPKVILKSGKDRSIKRFHPWIFSGAIKNIIGNPIEGDNVVVFDNSNNFLGLGHYQKGGSISVRVYTFDEIDPNREFWKSKIINAINLRKECGYFDNPNTNVCRLIHGEGDGFPGFICDYYNGTVVFQSHSTGMYKLEDTFADIFKEVLGNKVTTIYDKSDKTLPKIDGKTIENRFLFGNQAEGIVKEYDTKFYVNVVEGQKTGYFIDQRENRNLLRQYSNGHKVLNMFCYTGGFSVASLMGKAKSVTSVDASQIAIDLTNRNVEMNFPNCQNHNALATDAFEFLDKMEKNEYDLIVLDPPAFAKHASAINQAIKGYTRINRTAMEKIAPGSLLFTFSCSQAIDKLTFRMAVMEASIQAGRKIRILHQLTQPNDHPISIYHPEGEYLKGLVVYVE
ncbi:MAG: class I SAM-dependent rRNA methyltransferase [Bacteroidales bacterium]|nr:class I SAM-dependent rRNA methyltransferase [Bacteroidales bacterium]